MKWLLVLAVWAWGCDSGGADADPVQDAAVTDRGRLDEGPAGDATLTDAAPDAAPDAVPDATPPDAGGPACPQPAPANPNEVATAAGLIKGRQEGNVRIFLGIPFAAPPVGDLRWRAPADPGCLPPNGFEATRFGPQCPQLDADGAPTGDEDCLQLNVWAPATGTGHPVMVFIHGGGNVQGSATVGAAGQILYDGARLAGPHDVVVVTLQYRLGALGWLVRPSLADADGRQGNYALLDEVAALQWVQAHIEAFGGNPNQVMIFGESAGAVNVCTLVASPRAAGLFDVSLMESGACLLPTAADVERAGREQTEAVGCVGANEAECLRSKTAFELLTAYPPEVGVASRGSTLQPYIDGVVLPDQPETIIRAGRHNRGVFVAGANSDETAQFVPNIADAAAYEAAIRAQFGVYANRVLEAYPLNDFPTAREAMVAVTTDARFVCTTRRAVRAASLHGPAYLYHFSQALDNAPRLHILGAYHGLELFFVFQNLEFAGYRPSPAERALSVAMGGYWTRLATTGDPNGGDAPVWPTHDAAGDGHLLLDGAGVTPGTGLRQARCNFWDALIDGQ